MAGPYTIYFAGQLFDHKHLAGNALLASCIDSDSQGRYRCILPQNLEQRGIGPMGIRDQDLRTVMECDLALFNFDGSELPPGAVVEYMYAKMLDIPAVILRTDFRGGGDQDAEGDPWNLMASFYPRTRTPASRRHAVVSGCAGAGRRRNTGLRSLPATDCKRGY